ncbi:MAG: hypothetical protein K8S56_02515 [Candidatus Cloacimonetes bacterium]|nr:hypothetical protein [Candidatus Cloacimonadota bacterium]
MLVILLLIILGLVLQQAGVIPLLYLNILLIISTAYVWGKSWISKVILLVCMVAFVSLAGFVIRSDRIILLIQLVITLSGILRKFIRRRQEPQQDISSDVLREFWSTLEQADKKMKKKD